jgi:tRNA-2-methylthio-N6-dimethylallyladenosine synthase
LNAVVLEVATERAQRFQGREMEVLVEGPNPKDAGQACGRIRHNKLVYFDGDGAALLGRLVTVRIDRCNAYSLYGTLVGDAPSVAAAVAAAAAAAGQQQQQRAAEPALA